MAKKKELTKEVEPKAATEGKNIKDVNLALAETIEDVENMDINMVATTYDKMISDYKEYIENMSLEELKEEEKRIIEKANAWDIELKSKVYKLSSKTKWQEKEISRVQIGAKIRAILEKFECEYKYTLGMYQMASWWANPKADIEFSVLDSTLRILGQPGLKYKGPKEWENILIIDHYFKECNAEYSRDTLRTYMWAGRHNAILDKIQILSPIKSDTTGREVEQQSEGNIELVES